MTHGGKKEDFPERRFMIRYPSNSGALVIRENDKMRSGIEAILRDLSHAGLGINMNGPLEVNEQVKVRLKNEVQRFEKEVRGTVRHCTPMDEGVFYIGIELFTRLTPLEASLLKMGIVDKSGTDEAKWI